MDTWKWTPGSLEFPFGNHPFSTLILQVAYVTCIVSCWISVGATKPYYYKQQIGTLNEILGHPDTKKHSQARLCTAKVDRMGFLSLFRGGRWRKLQVCWHRSTYPYNEFSKSFTKQLHSGKLKEDTWHMDKNNRLKMYLLLKMVTFQCQCWCSRGILDKPSLQQMEQQADTVSPVFHWGILDAFITSYVNFVQCFFPYSRSVPTRWAPSSYKWSYNPYKWPDKWLTVLVTLVIGVINPVVTASGPIL